MNPNQNKPSLHIVLSNSKIWPLISSALVCLWGLPSFEGRAQSPSALYTWAGTGDIRAWIKGFGANTVTLDNTIAGELQVTETGGAGASVAISDGFNRVRESSTSASGGTDLTGLDFLEFDLGHNGAGPINVQFYVQATTGSSFVSLGPDVAVSPGVNTYQSSLSGLTAAQAVYVRTIGFNAREHAALGDVIWTLREVRAGGTPLAMRELINHDDLDVEGGLQGAFANFDLGAILGNDGGQNQSGLSHNPAGSGSLRWTDLGGTNGAAICWGNGTAWNGNTFNNRTTDLSNYDKMVIRMSASEVTPGAGGTLGVQGFFQKNNFSFQSVEAGVGKLLPIDGQFHDLEYSLAGLTSMNVVDVTGINLFSHPTDLIIDVDSIRFSTAPLTIKTVERSGQDINLTFRTSSGQTYAVEYFSDLNPGSPTNVLGGNIIGDGQDATVTDPTAVMDAPSRFYRVNQLP